MRGTSWTTMASAGISASRRAVSARTSGWTMPLRRCRASSSEKTMAPSFSRSRAPSSSMMSGPKAAVTAANPSVPSATTSRAMRSASMTRAPSLANSAATLDFPAPIPPVRPMRNTSSSLGRSDLAGVVRRRGRGGGETTQLDRAARLLRILGVDRGVVVVLGDAALPVAVHGHPAGVELQFASQVAAHRAQRVGLAAEPQQARPVGQGEPAHRLLQEGTRGELGATLEPAHVVVARQRVALILGVHHLDEDGCPRVGADAIQDARHGRQRGFVAADDEPLRLRRKQPRSSGAGTHEALAHLYLFGPRSEEHT